MKNASTENGMGRFGALILACALSGMAQNQPWEKMEMGGFAIWQSPEWKTGPGLGSPGGSILGTDKSGRLYVSNGTDLHIGSQAGSQWSKHERLPTGISGLDHSRPLAVGGTGTVLWGGWVSQDAGATWSGGNSVYTLAYGVHATGPVFAGSGNDGIERGTLGSSLAWTHAHSGNTFGTIKQFEMGESGYIFAVPEYGPALISTDTGRKWSEWRVSGLNNGLDGGSIRTLAVDHRSGTPAWVAEERPNNAKGNLLIRMHIFFPAVDTIRAATLPDSAITALLVGSDGTLWVGTRGQGLWMSTDNGQTFTPSNSGLGGFFVESIAETSDKRLFVLTREGLYRLRTTGASLRPLLSRTFLRGNKASLHLPGITPYRPASGSARISVLADGRMLIMPQENSSINNPSNTR